MTLVQFFEVDFEQCFFLCSISYKGNKFFIEGIVERFLSFFFSSYWDVGFSFLLVFSNNFYLISASFSLK